MQKKWYIGGFIALFSLLVVLQQQVVVPNQEIVLEFADGVTTSCKAQNTLETVVNRLRAAGVTEVKVSSDLTEGKLKITYYSNTSIGNIKELLAETQNAQIARELLEDEQGTDQNSDKDSKDFRLDVYELHKSLDNDIDANRKFIVELKQELKGDASGKVYTIPAATVTSDYMSYLFFISEKINGITVCSFDTVSFELPLVRAGPMA